MRGNKITLRPLELNDCTERYVNWLNDPFVNRWLETRYVTQTLETIRTYVKNTGGMYAILNEDQVHIGNLRLGPVSDRHETASVSYFIGDRSNWGKGYASDAVKTICNHAFNKLKLHKVKAGAYGKNVGSHRVLLKAGFTLEGTLQSELKTDAG